MGIKCCIVDTLLATNVFHLRDSARIQCSTIVESVHANMELSTICKSVFVFCNNSANNTAPHNSNLGIDTCFKGDTRVFDVNKVVTYLFIYLFT